MNEEDQIGELLKGLIITEGTIFSPEGNDELKTIEVDVILKRKTWKNIDEKMMLLKGYE